MKTADMIEQRAGLVSRMTEAHEADDTDAFTTAETELRALDAKLERQKKIDAADRAEPGQPLGGDAKLDREIRSRFNIGRAVAGAAGLDVDWGFEREVQPELQQRAGRKAQGVFIPTEVFETRALTSNGDGADLIPTDHRPDQYINALTASSVIRSMGATVLTGLTGNVDIPREAGSPAIGWVAENTALSADDASFDSVQLSPKHAGAISSWSRNMVQQSSPEIEGLFRRMLARDLALAIDKAAIQGGGANEPVGILETAGIQTQAFDTDLIDTTAEMIALADIANVDARRSFLTSPGVRKTAMKAKDGDGLPIPMATQFHGEPMTFSNQVPTDLGDGTEHCLLYGDFSEMLMGIWSEIDILVNPYEATAFGKGNIAVRAMATVDAALRHPAAFVSATGVPVA